MFGQPSTYLLTGAEKSALEERLNPVVLWSRVLVFIFVVSGALALFMVRATAIIKDHEVWYKYTSSVAVALCLLALCLLGVALRGDVVAQIVGGTSGLVAPYAWPVPCPRYGGWRGIGHESGPAADAGWQCRHTPPYDVSSA